jgi:hypothetical protein
MGARLALLAATLVLAVCPVRAQEPEPAVNVSRGAGPSTSPAIAFDSNGTAHVAWADLPDGSGLEVQFVYYARSFDGGATFEAPRRLSAGVDDGTRAREVRLVVAPSGLVAVAWWANVVDEQSRVFLTAFVATSDDGGATFGDPATTSLRFRRDRLAKEGFANTTTLSLAAAPAGGVALLATVSDYNRGFNVYFAASPDGVAFSDPIRVSSYSLVIPRAATNALAFVGERRVVAVWTESHGDFVDEIEDVYSVESDDSGRTFSAPRRVTRVRGLVGALLRTADETLLATQLQKTPRSNHVLKIFRSTNGGSTYTERHKIAKTGNTSHLHQSSMASNALGVIALAWIENSPTPVVPQGIYVAVSRDGGRTFDAPRFARAGLFIDPPAVAVDPTGRPVVVFATAEPDPEEREVFVHRVAP